MAAIDASMTSSAIQVLLQAGAIYGRQTGQDEQTKKQDKVAAQMTSAFKAMSESLPSDD